MIQAGLGLSARGLRQLLSLPRPRVGAFFGARSGNGPEQLAVTLARSLIDPRSAVSVDPPLQRHKPPSRLWAFRRTPTPKPPNHEETPLAGPDLLGTPEAPRREPSSRILSPPNPSPRLGCDDVTLN